MITMEKSKYNSTKINELVESMKNTASAIERDFNSGVAIYGAGLVGTWAVGYLKSIDANIKYFIDRDPAKTGTKIHDIEVILPTDARINEINSIFIASRHYVKEVMKNLGEENFNMISFDGYFVVRNYEKLKNIRENYFEDEKSVEVFNAVLHAMLTSTLDGCRDVMEKDMYFCLPEFSATFEDTFVDAGAFVGDSTEKFIWENLGTFKHIYAFEPGKKQFVALTKRMDRLKDEWAYDEDKVTLVNAGLGAQNSEMSCTFVEDFPIRHGLIDCNTEDSNKSEQKIPVYSLDEFLNGERVSFLKVDIEGMEMDFLKGAQNTILENKPKIAICIYHYPSDLYEVAEYIRKLVPEYKFAMRQHAPIFGDFVLYCYV